MSDNIRQRICIKSCTSFDKELALNLWTSLNSIPYWLVQRVLYTILCSLKINLTSQWFCRSSVSCEDYSPCRLVVSRVASGFMLQKRRASPMRGCTERPALAHSVNSSHCGTKLLFTCDAGNTVSPPASTSLLLHPSPFTPQPVSSSNP